MAEIMKGHSLSEKIKERVRKDVEHLKEHGIDVGLGLLMFDDNPAAKQYFLATLKACKKAGVKAYEYILPADASVNEMLNKVHSINNDERINGLLVLFPLPKKINPRRIVNEILPEKDIDGLGSLSVGRLAADESTFQIFKNGGYDNLYEGMAMHAISSYLPCTPFGVIRLIESYGIDIKGKHAVVIGKSLAVGKPLSLMFLAKEATVTVCHRETKDLGNFTRQADILCSATGVKGLITGDMVKVGAVVVDIGINVLKDGSIVGDVDFGSVEKKASFITPVPGGVGPVTIAMLLENTVRSAQRNQLMKHPLIVG
ncbi:MAG: bifunctional 5,10-methylenetetrahydrofolate dehydrogenase/5,10-methenyltetrahydrofolate cyclohydrolase [Thermodesulfovibrionia bacterium]|nr:bifunctional 5,10-methylenetetrahydrofolate dehydrogenase/5,10-methenyltetrahydrofolate cyclohydrolase [Thermodesulfovibrionia bacterium]